jgi:tetratricopeptide (TPR) repeat protein
VSWASQAIPAHLQLLDATLLFYAGQAENAWDLSEHVLADAGGSEPGILARLHFLRGLIAAERGDRQQLRTSLAALDAADSKALDVDRAELRGRLAMAERHWAEAVAAFVTAAALHQKALDYPNMVRALAMAGDASVQMGQLQEALIFFFRAGRSAARLEMANEALQWLTQTQQLAQHTGDMRMRTDITAHLISLKARVSSQGQSNTR